MESETYARLVDKYTAHELCDIYRDADGLYRMQTPSERALASRVYGLDLSRTLGDSDKKSCARCARPLTAIRVAEHWVMDEGRLYWCADCVTQRPVATIQHFVTTKMPRKIADIVCQINEHPSVWQLNADTKRMIQWLAAENNRSTHDNKYLKSVWRFLYHGTE